jgi:putative aminopeptidase FrvX
MSFDAEFFRSLCLAPGPTGFEAPVQRVLRERLGQRFRVGADALGDLWAEAGAADGPQLLAAAHADQIGLIVTHVDEHGFVSFAAVGGVDQQLLPGHELVILAAAGPVAGVVGRRPTHFIPKEDRGKAPDLHEQYIDIGARDHDDALRRVAVGDPITFAPRFLELADDTYATLAADDRAGVYAVFRALELYDEAPGAVRLVALSTVHEETTFMGAKTQAKLRQPEAVVVVDVDFATDYPGMDPKKAGGELKLGAGPVLARGTGSHARLFELARETAKAEGIDVQVRAAPGSMSTDADELMAAGAAALSLSIPLRYMHSPFEVVRGHDLEQAARLLAALARRLGEIIKPGWSHL